MSHPYPGPGTVLANRYRVIRRIGEGGMGVVLEAQNTITEKRVAIKWLHAAVAHSPEAAQRMMREATASCRVRHANVIDVYDVFQQGDAIFLVMELLHGEPLRSVIERGELPPHAIVALLLPAIDGVAEAHRQGVIHRDIHPGNIFLARPSPDAAPVPIVLDFGISKLALEDERARLTRSGMTMGTPLYMSYEQMCSARDVDPRADVYSFGVILYEAMTGRLPFVGETFADVAMKVATGSPVPPRALRPELPEALEHVILRAMARNREERIESLDALSAALRPFASDPASRITPPAPELRDEPEREPAPQRDAAAHAHVPSASERGRAVPSPVVRVDTLGHVSTPLAHTGPVHAEAPPLPPDRRWQAALLGAGLVALLGVGAWAAIERAPSSEARGDAVPRLPRVPALPLAPAPTTHASARGEIASDARPSAAGASATGDLTSPAPARATTALDPSRRALAPTSTPASSGAVELGDAGVRAPGPTRVAAGPRGLPAAPSAPAAFGPATPSASPAARPAAWVTSPVPTAASASSIGLVRSTPPDAGVPLRAGHVTRDQF